MKQKAGKLKHRGPFIISGAVLLTVLVLLQAAFDIYAYQSIVRPGGDGQLAQLIIHAVEVLRKPAPVDPVSGRVYLTEARLVLPAPANSIDQIEYDEVGGRGADVELQVSTKVIMGLAEAKLLTAPSLVAGPVQRPNNVIDQVPNLQACARGVQLFFHPAEASDGALQLKGTKVLANGQTLYFYTEAVCHQDLTGLLGYLKQAESY